MKRSLWVFLYGVAIVVFSCGMALAQEAPADLGPEIMPVKFKAEKAVLRTPAEMQAAEALAPLYEGSSAGKPFMPTMDPSAYKALKEAQKAQAAAQAPGGKGVESFAPSALAPPVFRGVSFEGTNGTAAGGFRPPDTHGAVGPSNYVQIVNVRYLVYSRTGVLLQSRTLQSLFAATETLFDPRVIYDSVWKRWIVLATRRSISSTDTARWLYIAVSQTSSPTGSFFIYRQTLPLVAGGWCDYPQLGMDYDSILITSNVFTFAGFYSTTFAFAWPKANFYNGMGFQFNYFGGLQGTLAPPIVRDRNPSTFFVAAPPAGSALRLYTMTNSSRLPSSLSGPVSIAVPAWTVPRDARQPGTTNTLDTLDARFVNASSQVGTSLFNVHTIDFPGTLTFPVPKWYRINTATRTIAQQGFFFENATSDDFNASIAANDAGDAFVTWSSTMPLQAHVRFSGKRSAEAAIPAGATLAGGTSATFYNPSTATAERWGDYSAVSVDPLNQNNAWITNEKINSQTVWGSRIGLIGF
jgi:hypothetical protein